MAEITEEQYSVAYEYGKKLYNNQITLVTAAKNVADKTNMANSSAKMYIEAVSYMLKGNIYRRSISQEAIEYYLQKIKNEFSGDVFKLALSSIEQYIEDGKSSGQNRPGLEAILERYQKIQGESSMQLGDLNEIGNECKSNYEKNYTWREVALSDDFLSKFKMRFESDIGGKLLTGCYSGRHIPNTGNSVDFSYQMLEVITYYLEYVSEVQKYSKIVKSAFSVVEEMHRKALEAIVKDKENPDHLFFKNIITAGSNWKTKLNITYGVPVLETFEQELLSNVPDEEDRKKVIKALSVKDWSHATKTFERKESDYAASGCLALMKVVKNKQGFYEDLLRFFSKEENADLLNMLKDKLDEQTQPNNFQPLLSQQAGSGKNLIVYGAPGSGKSYYINQITSEKNTVRTVFHPEYQNSDFVGGLRPHKEDGEITYSFVPGPLINALLLATEKQDEHVYLIIEEINRANAAAVFGDIFQLLDRHEKNYSEYTVTPEETLKNYLDDQGYPTPSELRIPSNLSIMATMNSSDQGVFLLDSAFKRRWGFKYCPIDFTEHTKKDSFTNKVVPYRGSEFSWSDFASVINNTLKRKEIEEDRLIGPYFLTEKERSNKDACKQAIAGKLLIYLWDDVLRHSLRDQLFSSRIHTFSDLVNAYNSSKPIFTDQVEELLEDELEDSASPPETETLAQTGS